jgi:Excinuclease ATPase subunit
LRLLYSSIGVPHCPLCGHEISQQSTGQIVQQALSLSPGERIMVLAPVVRGRKGEYKKDLEKLSRQGFERARIDGVLHSLDEDIPLDRRKNHTIEVVVDRLLIKPGIERRLEESVATATKLAGGLVTIAVVNGEDKLYSLKLACPECGTSVPQLEPRSFSFNSQYGACERCQGLGSVWMFDPDKIVVNCAKPLLSGALAEEVDLSYSRWSMESLARKHQIKLSTPFRKLSDRERTLLLEGEGGRGGLLAMLKDKHGRARAEERESLEQYMSLIDCKDCGGKRLLASSLAVRVKGMSIAEFTDMPISRALLTVRSWEFGEREMQIVGRLVAEIRNRLEFLAEVGLDYLSLDRSAATLSGGEGQRIRLATQMGRSCGASCMYSTSPPSDSIRATMSACSTLSPVCAIWATPCSWWSMTPRPSNARITLSTWGPAPAVWAGIWWPPAIRSRSRATTIRSPGSISPGSRRFPLPIFAASPAIRRSQLWAPGITISKVSMSRSHWGCSP